MITGVIAAVFVIAMIAAGSNGQWGSVAVGAVIVVFLLCLGGESRKCDRAYNNAVECWSEGGPERQERRRN